MNYSEFIALMQVYADETGFSSNPHRNHKNREIILEAAKEDKDKIISYSLLAMKRTEEMHLHNALYLLYTLVPEEELPPINKAYYGCMRVIEAIWLAWGHGLDFSPKTKMYIAKGYNPQAYWDYSLFDPEAKEMDSKYRNKGIEF